MGAPNLYSAFVLIDPKMNYSSIKISQKAILYRISGKKVVRQQSEYGWLGASEKVYGLKEVVGSKRSIGHQGAGRCSAYS